MTSIRVNIKPELLTWARSSSGWELEAIAKSIGVAPHKIDEWERGDQGPTMRQLELFANKVKRPLAAFFMPEPPADPPLPCDFRTLPETERGRFGPETLLAFREARSLHQMHLELLDLTWPEQPRSLPEVSLGDDPERVANAFREQMGVSADHQTEWPDEYAALSAWREALYALGVLTLQFPLPLSDARGFSMYDSRFSVIGVSTRDAVPARIFSIFHELCHLCLRQPGVSAVPTDFRVRHADSRSDIEQFCNRFASGVLLPLDDPTVQNHLVKAAQGGKDEDADIRWAAKRLKVSKYVLLRRLVAAGYRAESDYRRWAAIWNIQAAAYVPPVHKTGGPGPVTISMSRRGRDFSQLVFAALDMGRISLRQASRYLSLDPGKFGQARSRLFSGTASE